jgi:hypothetical protein
MRFGLWLVCYVGGLALLVPVSWRLRVAMTSASADPSTMDRVVSLAVLYNTLSSMVACALAIPALLRPLGRRGAAGGGAAVAPYGKPARLAQQREQRRRVTSRCGLCCILLVMLVVVAAMRAGGFSSLGAQLAVDLLSPAPTNGGGAWGGPRLRGAVDFAQELAVVQAPRALVVTLPWLARFGRGRRGAQLRSPFVMLVGLGLGATCGCIGRIQLVAQSQAMLQTRLITQAFPQLDTGAAAGHNDQETTAAGGGGQWNASWVPSGAEAAADIGCALLREPLVSSCSTNCFEMSWSDSCGPRDAPPLVMKTVRSGAGKPIQVPATSTAAGGVEEPPPRRVDCRIETR